MGFKNDEWVELQGIIEQPTGKAVLFLADDWDKAEWIPRSQMEILQIDEDADPKHYVIHVKKWLAEKNGWVEKK